MPVQVRVEQEGTPTTAVYLAIAEKVRGERERLTFQLDEIDLQFSQAVAMCQSDNDLVELIEVVKHVKTLAVAESSELEGSSSIWDGVLLGGGIIRYKHCGSFH